MRSRRRGRGDLFRDAPGSIGIDMADCPDGKHAGVCVAFFITLEGLAKVWTGCRRRVLAGVWAGQRVIRAVRVLQVGLCMACVAAAGLMGAKATPQSFSSEDRILICRATIAALMGRPINIVVATEVDDAVVRTSYRRPDDGSIWQNLCRLEGKRVVWASVWKDGSLGRWRNHPLDSIVTFQLSGSGVTIFVDGSSTAKSYPRRT